MPPRKRGKNGKGAPAEDRGDRISVLPDALLHHVLSFLPVEDAVRTCVLARRWRHLWKSATGLRIGCHDEDESMSVDDLREFVDHILLLRGGSPLQKCELRIGNFCYSDKARVNLWFGHALVCKVRLLKISIHRNNYVEHQNHSLDPYLWLDDVPLVSKHMTRLELHGVLCHTSFLDFSSSPALEHLEFDVCDFTLATKISSESLTSLSITDSRFSVDYRLQIYAPNLVIRSLVEAFVRISAGCDDRCDKLWFANRIVLVTIIVTVLMMLPMLVACF